MSFLKTILVILVLTSCVPKGLTPKIRLSQLKKLPTNITSGDLEVLFDSSSSLVREDQGNAQITLLLTQPSDKEVEVEVYVFNGSTDANDHQMVGSNKVKFMPGETIKNIELQLMNDNLKEGRETFTLILRNPTNANAGSVSSHIVQVEDDDMPGQGTVAFANPLPSKEAFEQSLYQVTTEPGKCQGCHSTTGIFPAVPHSDQNVDLAHQTMMGVSFFSEPYIDLNNPSNSFIVKKMTAPPFGNHNGFSQEMADRLEWGIENWKRLMAGQEPLPDPNAPVSRVTITGAMATLVTGKTLKFDYDLKTENFSGSLEVQRSLSQSGPFVTINYIYLNDDSRVQNMSYSDEDTTKNYDTTYFYKVTAKDAGKSTVAESDVVSAKTALTPIQDVRFNSFSTNLMGDRNTSLNWSMSGFQGNLKIFRAEGNMVNFNEIATLPASAISYEDNTNLNYDTDYFYQIKAYDSLGRELVASVIRSIKTNKDPSSVVSVNFGPLNAAAKGTTVTLNWTMTEINFQGTLRVMRAKNSTTNFTQVASLTKSSRTYIDSGLENATDYSYKIEAINTSSQLIKTSGIATAMTDAADPIISISLASANLILGKNIRLMYLISALRLPSETPVEYFVQRSTNSDGGFTKIAQVELFSNTFVDMDSTKQFDTTYYYRIVAESSNFVIRTSNVLSAKTALESQPTPMASLNNFTATLENDRNILVQGQVSLQDVQGSVSLQRRIQGSNLSWQNIKVINVTTSSTSVTLNELDSNLQYDTTYEYKVRVVTSSGDDVLLNSTPISKKTNAQPTSASFTSISGTVSNLKTVNLTWTLEATNFTGSIAVYRKKQGAANFTMQANLTATSRFYSDTDATKEYDTNYIYRLEARSGNTLLATSSDVSVKTAQDPVPAQPYKFLSFSASVTTGSNVKVSWEKEGTTDQMITIRRATSTSGPFSAIGNVNAMETQFLDTSNKQEGSTYVYQATTTSSGMTIASPMTSVKIGGIATGDYLAIDLINANTDTRFKVLENNMEIQASELPSLANFEVRSRGSQVVAISLRGPVNSDTTDYTAPYTLYQKVGNDYLGASLPTGDYRISAVDEGLHSKTIDFSIVGSTPPIPQAPNFLFFQAELQPSSGSVSLTWMTDIPFANNTMLEVHRSTGSSASTVITTLASSATSFLDISSLNEGQIYSYKIVAKDLSGMIIAQTSGSSVQIPASNPVFSSFNLVLKSGTTKEVQLSFSSSKSWDGYIGLYRGTSENNLVQIKEVSPGVRFLTDVTPNNDTRYFYQFKGFNVNGDELASTVVKSIVTAPSPTTPIPIITSATAVLLADKSGIKIDWAVDNPINDMSFSIARKIDGVDDGNLTDFSLTSTARTYTDRNIQPGKTYQYRVSLNINGTNIFIKGTQVVSVPADPDPSPVITMASAILNTDGTIKVSWQASDVSTTMSFSVMKKVDNGSFQILNSGLPSSARELTDIEIFAGRSYQYMVEVYEGVNPLAQKTTNVVTTDPPPKPNGVTPKEAFEQTVHIFTTNSCVACHSSSALLANFLPHGDSDVDIAFNAVYDKSDVNNVKYMDLDNPAASAMVMKLRSGHNGFTNQEADELQVEITKMKELIDGSGGGATDPSVLRGQALYSQHCASCHLPIEQSTKKGRTPGDVELALLFVPEMEKDIPAGTLSPQDIIDIGNALIDAAGGTPDQ